MIRLTNAMKIISIVAAACALAACTGGSEPSSSPPPSTQTSGSAPTSSSSPGGSAAETAPPAESSSASEQTSRTERPPTESFELMTGEGYQSRTAALHQGEGFSLYVFEGFGFDQASGRLTLTANNDYYVDIERLPEDEILKTLRESAEQEFKEFGKVSDYSGELVEHPLGYAELYLQSSGADGVKDFIIWESEAGERYLFRLHSPKGEEAPDFASSVWVSLSTVRGE
ncbi:hypothetical protein [Cohnella hongkongensis]|uniref:Lipoprotein n=1 Tax=Cohnella hongkongensis TaxID=178337 RepID=A0ABV9FHT0_9BACL